MTSNNDQTDSILHPAFRLLVALRDAGCNVFIDDDQLFVSPPARAVEWDGDVEAAIDAHYWELKDLVNVLASAVTMIRDGH